MAEYFVGHLAKEVGMNVETIRYYEKQKLLPKPKLKEDSRYRVYDETDLKRLLFIKRSKELGFTLKEISELLNLKVESSATCGDVKHLAEHKLNDVEEKIKQKPCGLKSAGLFKFIKFTDPISSLPLF